MRKYQGVPPSTKRKMSSSPWIMVSLVDLSEEIFRWDDTSSSSNPTSSDPATPLRERRSNEQTEALLEGASEATPALMTELIPSDDHFNLQQRPSTLGLFKGVHPLKDRAAGKASRQGAGIYQVGRSPAEDLIAYSDLLKRLRFHVFFGTAADLKEAAVSFKEAAVILKPPPKIIQSKPSLREVVQYYLGLLEV